jgi:DNA-binding HxlR family transcriptional regulator
LYTIRRPGEMRECLKDMDYYCPIEVTLEVIGGKWKPLVLFQLFGGTRRFGELKRAMPKITQRMLTRQLRELEEDGLVHREVYAQVPPKVEYSLTEVGWGLEPLVRRMDEWGEWYATESEEIGVGRKDRETS